MGQRVTNLITVVLADNHRTFAEGLGVMLDAQDDLAVLGVARNAPHAVELAARHEPTVLLLDAQISGADLVSTIRAVKAVSPGSKVLMLSADTRKETITEALHAGADGFFAKDASSRQVASAIRSLARGRTGMVVTAEPVASSPSTHAADASAAKHVDAELPDEHVRPAEGSERESEEALWRAADSGDSDGMYRLASLLQDQGRLEEAEPWWRRAAESGSTEAAINLGRLLSDLDPVQAEQWYRRAADTGSPEAAVRLGALLQQQGRPEEAEEWLQRAADAGSFEALARLTLLQPESSTEEVTQPSLREQVEWVSDSPANRDLLRRKPLARALATRLRRVNKDEPHTSFLVHVDGTWGAGKSTLLNFLRADLEQDWLVVGFDAWRQSSVGPAWWALLAALRHDLARSLRWRTRVRLRLAEGWARVRRAGAPYLLALSLLVVVAGGVFLLLRPRQLDSKAIEDLAKTVIAVLSAVGTLWAGTLVAGRFLLWDSARGARLFEQSSTNPMQGVADHFAWLLRRVGRPVVFLIDDLDRCAEGYVVELLDAVQTLLRDAPRRVLREDTRGFETYFVVAADGAWIRTSYEVAYQTFATSVTEPGRPLGHLFLDKLFQLTVPVPTLSPEAQDAYLKALLRTTKAAAEPAVHVEARAVRKSVQESRSEADVVEALRQASPSARRLVAEDAVDRLSAPEVEAATEHALQRFASLVDPNPRSMKRFLNSYSMLRAVRTLEGSTVSTEPLALWTILQTRWPSLADHLRRHPDAIEHAGKAEHAHTIPQTLRPLLELPEFRRLLAFGSVPLTAEVIRACSGIAGASDSEP